MADNQNKVIINVYLDLQFLKFLKFLKFQIF
jgi:hypothetical protein